MKILLANQHIVGSVSNEETFWSILGKNLSGAETVALKDYKGTLTNYAQDSQPDVIVYNSILGNINIPKKLKKIVLLQDNFILMDKVIAKTFRQKLSRLVKGKSHFYMRSILMQKEAIKNADKVVAVSHSVATTYGVDAEIIPIGVDSNLFCPMDKKILREKYKINHSVFVKIFVGSTHLVKGFDFILEEIRKDKDSLFLIVLKDDEVPVIDLPNVKIFQKLNQKNLAELYNCADQFIGRSRVETLWLAPIEALFCNIPIDVTPVGIFADWMPSNINPRKEAFEKELDMNTMIEKWRALVTDLTQK